MMSLLLQTEMLPLQLDIDGTIRVARTRVTLETVVCAFKSGATAEQIAQDYSVLSLADVYAVITYYLQHRTDVECYLTEHQQQSQQQREAMEVRFPPAGIRERLLARRTVKG